MSGDLFLPVHRIELPIHSHVEWQAIPTNSGLLMVGADSSTDGHAIGLARSVPLQSLATDLLSARATRSVAPPAFGQVPSS